MNQGISRQLLTLKFLHLLLPYSIYQSGVTGTPEPSLMRSTSYCYRSFNLSLNILFLISLQEGVLNHDRHYIDEIQGNGNKSEFDHQLRAYPDSASHLLIE